MGTLYIVATPIGNLGDISKRAIDTLKNVDIILCEDTRTSSNLLKSYNIETKLISYHKFNEEKRTSEIISLLKNDKNIALITDAGTPCISDPGSILINDAIKNNINVFSIPGASALITALSLSGLIINNFSFYGFLERKPNLQKKQLNQINSDNSEISVIYESPKRIIKTLKNILEVMNNPYIILLNDLTKKFERKYYGLTNEVIFELENNLNHELGEYVLIIKKNLINELINETDISLEARLIDEIIKNNVTMKDAINIVKEKYSDKYSKNEIYQASLNIKKKIL